MAIGGYCKVQAQSSSASPEAAQRVVAPPDRGLRLDLAECWCSVLSTSTVCMHSFIQQRISPLPHPGRGIKEASELGTALPLG